MTKNSTTKPAPKKATPKRITIPKGMTAQQAMDLLNKPAEQEDASTKVHVPLGLDPGAVRSLISLLAKTQPGEEIRLKFAETVNEYGTHALLVTPLPAAFEGKKAEQEVEETRPGTLVAITDVIQHNGSVLLQAAHVLNIQLDRIDGGNPDGFGEAVSQKSEDRRPNINAKLEGIAATQRQTVTLIEQALNRVIALVN